ncbi:MAG: hypothetical protein H6719_02235 [Sandaracinaceae bacterium]|nr:hypothetical protein [Sandaracinaceae bacterium]
MSRFWAGFSVASLVWVAAGAYLYFGLGFAPPVEEPLVVDSEPEEVEVEPEAPPTKAPRRRRRRRGAAAASRRGETPTGNATTGDDLGEDEMRTVDMGGSGGEQQLSGAQVDAGFDTVMGGIRRCLVLIPGDADVHGRVTFGLRIAGSGQVTRVSLSGPRAATTGECGSCLQRTARSIRFPSFDGPEMVVRYPLTLE